MRNPVFFPSKLNVGVLMCDLQYCSTLVVQMLFIVLPHLSYSFRRVNVQQFYSSLLIVLFSHLLFIVALPPTSAGFIVDIVDMLYRLSYIKCFIVQNVHIASLLLIYGCFLPSTHLCLREFHKKVPKICDFQVERKQTLKKHGKLLESLRKNVGTNWKPEKF